jgi:hypothetical protein
MSRPPGRKPITKEMREARRKEAEERNAQWAALTPLQQVASLNARGMRAIKQRKKIALRARRLELEAKEREAAKTAPKKSKRP